MTILATETFDSYAEDATYAPSAPWTMTGADATTKAAASAHGGMGMRVNAPASYSFARFNETVTSDTRVYDMYFRPRNVPGNLIFMSASGSSKLGDMRLNSNGTVTLRNVNTAVGTSAATLSYDGTLYRAAWKVGGGAQELRVYLGESATPLLTITGACGATTGEVGFGLIAALSGAQIDVDTIRIADDWLDPFDPEDPPTEAFTHYRISSGGLVPMRVTRPFEGGGGGDMGTPANPPSIYFAHRAMIPGPANTLYGYQQIDISSPTSIMDADLQRLYDGTWVLCHDEQIDALTDPTSPIKTGTVDEDFNAAQWATILMKTYDGSGTPRPAGTLAQIADYYGPGGPMAGKVMALEIKTTSPYADGLDAIEAAGLKAQTILTSFSRNAIIEAGSRGFYTQYITNTPNFSQLVADGVSVLGINKTSLTSTICDNAHAVGIKVAPFTIYTQQEANTYLSMGADYICTDYPADLNPA